jgi:nucleotide-binding universal stress UspA family protein
VTFQSILCPVDFSPQSGTALRTAVATARYFNASLTVVFVQDTLLVAAGRASYGRRRFADRTRAELARFVKRAIPTASEGRPDIALLVADGSPADEILRQAKRMRSDLVVMGSHGLNGIRKVFFGSTTEQLLRHAAVPVLAIPPSIGSRRLAGFPTHVTRVIAPIDLAGEWQSDATRAATIAGELDAELLLVHVLAAVQTPPWLRSTGPSSERRRIEKARAALERVRMKLFSRQRHPITTIVLVGEPAYEVARLTKERESLVVMSLRGTAGVWGLRRGAVAYRVLTRASTPVLALPRRRIGGRFSVRAREALDQVLSARDRAEIAGIDALISGAAGRKPVRR